MSEEEDNTEAPVESRFTLENRKPKAMVTLGGKAITVDGKITKSDYFTFLNLSLDDYQDVQMTPTQARKLSSHLRHLSTGASAMTPMYCAGAVCPFASRCPLVQMKNDEDPEKRGHVTHGKAPVGKQCIIEVQLIKEWIMRYFEEFDVDPHNFTEVGYVTELADIMVMEMRINMSLAKAENADLMIEQTVGVDRDGDPITQKQVSPLLEVKERLANRKSKVIKLMVGDRQEKYKKEAALKVKLSDDPSAQMANMRQKLEELQRGLAGIDKEKQLSTGDQKQLPGSLSPEDLISSDE